MSALSGLLTRHGRPVPEQAVRDLTLFNTERGPDRAGRFVGGHVVLLHHALHFDALSRDEHQPVALRSGAVLTWDGRLDNREDLLIELDQHLSSQASDADIIGAAYERWGEDSFQRFIGDWSLAVWDPAKQAVILARDYMGNRPLYYVDTADEFAWSTCIETLVERYRLHDRPDERYIAGVLSFGPAPGVTPFESIQYLPPAHTLRAHVSAPSTLRRYWDFDVRSLRYGKRDTYYEELRHLLSEAVRVRLRARRPVWCQLSGGYDSSTLACLADTLVRRRLVEAPDLKLISRVFKDSPESDERIYMAAVEERCHRTSLKYDHKDTDVADLLGSLRPFPLSGSFDGAPEVKASGNPVMLSGEFGDLVMAKNKTHSIALTEHLHEFHFGQFFADALAWSWRSRRSLPQVVGDVFEWYLPAAGGRRLALRRLVRKAGERTGTANRRLAAAFGLTPAFAARTSPAPYVGPTVTRFPRSKRPMVQMLYTGASMRAASSSDGVPFLRYTFPFLHRPLVEFVLAVPHLVLWEPQTTRAGMRRALADVLPEAVLNRRNKAYASPAAARMLRPLALQLGARVETWELIRRGYVDPAALQRALQGVIDGSRDSGLSLQAMIGIEAWLRSLALTTNHSRSAALTHDGRGVRGTLNAQVSPAGS